nr:hypothetical protein [uncultured Deefgea sp.]
MNSLKFLIHMVALMPRGTYFLCFAKESKQRKATLYLRGLRPCWPKAMGCAKATSCQASPHLAADNRQGGGF